MNFPRRIIGVVAGLILISALPCSAADAIFRWQLFTTAPVANRVFTVTPAAVGTNGPALTTLDAMPFTNDASGVCTVSNMVAGGYTASIRGPSVFTPILFVIPATSGPVEVSTNLVPSLPDPNNTTAYTRAQSDARYLQFPPAGTPYAWVPSSTNAGAAYVWAPQQGTNSGGGGTNANTFQPTQFATNGTGDIVLKSGALATNLTGNLIGSASTSTNYSGTNNGDVIGPQTATVVAAVGTSTAANIHAAEQLANAATAANTAATIVKRDGSGNFTASLITAALAGNASTASTLSTTNAAISLASIKFANTNFIVGAGTVSGSALSHILTNSGANFSVMEPMNLIVVNSNQQYRVMQILSSSTVIIDELPVAGITNSAWGFYPNYLSFYDATSPPRFVAAISADGGYGFATLDSTNSAGLYLGLNSAKGWKVANGDYGALGPASSFYYRGTQVVNFSGLAHYDSLDLTASSQVSVPFGFTNLLTPGSNLTFYVGADFRGNVGASSLTATNANTNLSLTPLRLMASDANKGEVSLGVTPTEALNLAGVTGGIQTNLDARQVGSAALTNLAAGNASALTNLQGNAFSFASVIAHDNTTNYVPNLNAVIFGDITTSNDVCVTGVTGGPGAISISIDANGTSARNILIPDSMKLLSTNGATHTGTNFIWQLPVGSNVAWLSFEAKVANPSLTNVRVSVIIGGAASGGGGVGGSGTVTSVGLTPPAYLNASASPVTTSGTIVLSGNGNTATFDSLTITNGSTLTGIVTANNAGNTFVGAFTGQGSGVTNINPANLGAGQIPLANLTNVTGPYRTIYIPAGAMDALPTNAAVTGAATAATNSASTNLNRDAWTMSVAATNGLHWTWAAPPFWDLSTIKVRLIVTDTGTNASTATNYVWSVAALDSGNNASLATALGTAQQMTSGIYTNANLVSEATSTALTVGGSPAAGDYIDFSLKTLGGNGSFTVTNTSFQILGAVIQYLETTNKPTTL